MKRPVLVLVMSCFANAAFAAPGVDLSANHICPGVLGAYFQGSIDCAELATSGKSVSLYCTFIPAENISDLSSLDGIIDLYVDQGLTAGQFWIGGQEVYNGSPECGGPGSHVHMVPSKPTNGDPCGDAAEIRDVFTASTFVTLITDPNSLQMFYSVYNATPIAVTDAQRIFGFELRWDPTYSNEGGGSCGTCCGEEYFAMARATPGSRSGQTTTDLNTPTGTPGVGPDARLYGGASCNPVLTRATTWGQLKSLYR